MYPGSATESYQGQTAQLEQQVATLQKQVQQLLQNHQGANGQGNGQQTSPTVKKVASRPVSADFKPNMPQIYKILDSATKEDKILLHQIWGDVLASLPVTQSALLKACEPVAASSEGYVLAFEYEFLCAKAEENQELQTNMINYMQKVAQYSGGYVCVLRQQWQSIRQEYIMEKKRTKMGESASGATDANVGESVADDQEELETTVTSPVEEMALNTIQLFGEDVVNIIEE